MRRDHSTVLRAAAGTGKTTELARLYVSHLFVDGFAVRDVVAITFTRKAAAEIIERVCDVLHALDPESERREEAARILGPSLERYLQALAGHLPTSVQIKRALADLADAPVGTTDSFVQRILTEHALYAALPVGDGEVVPLDVPLGEGTSDPSRILLEEARSAVAPLTGAVRPEVAELLRYLSASAIAKLVSEGKPPTAKRPATLDAVYGGLASLLEDGIARAAGAKDARGALRVLLGLDGDGRGDALDEVVNKAGLTSVPAVEAWLVAKGGRSQAPGELVPFVAALKAPKKKDLVERIGFNAARFDFEIEVAGERVRVPLSHFGASGFPRDFFAEEQKARLERFRSCVDALRREVFARGLARAAREGALGHDELLAAAIRLCRDPRCPLAGRFRAMLVDEVQDSSPEQLELYQALRNAVPGMRMTFVGDSRQSIYLFRGAEPAGLDILEKSSKVEHIAENHRSVANLVEAQLELFGERLADAARDERLNGLEEVSRERLRPGPGKEAGIERPVTVIASTAEDFNTTRAAETALVAFAEELDAAWKAARKVRDGGVLRAAVLTPTWRLAAEACALLRNLLGPDRAFVDGGGNWVGGRVVRDLRILVAALLDRSEQLAWLGLWKHPMIGLSDRGLALARSSVGLSALVRKESRSAPSRTRHLGWLVDADALMAPHSEEDIAAFARARGPLREALLRIGGSPLSRVLEQLASDLKWREILSCGPEEEAPFHLDAALEWIRDMDGQGMTAAEILDALGGSDDGNAEAPRLELARPAEHVSCTTVFQAKGLQWDYVCVLQPGVSPGGSRERGRGSVVAGIGGEAMLLAPIKYDPGGAFAAERDPIAVIASAIEGQRKKEEELRLAYVAITRATQRVVTAIPGPKARKGALKLLAGAWGIDAILDGAAENDMRHVEIRVVEDAAEVPRGVRLGYATIAEGQNFGELASLRPPWVERSPSTLGRTLTEGGREALAARVATAAEVHLGNARTLDPPVDGGSEALDEATLGSMVHGWLERWRFGAGEKPSEEAAARYLAGEWGCPADLAPSYATWLVGIAELLAGAADSALWRLVTRPDVGLHFELPLVGAAAFDEAGESPFLLSGRADLLVEEPDGSWTVIDFKAGRHAPVPHAGGYAPERLVEEIDLGAYVAQLEGYARALNAAFESRTDRAKARVVRCALWFVRTGATVTWTPVGASERA